MKNIFLIAFFSLLLMACGGENVNTPKPKGYFRIYFPQKEYREFRSDAPYTFDYPVYADMNKDIDRGALPYWNNLDFPQFNARLHLTYYDVWSHEAYNKIVEAARTLAMEHTIKASAIDRRLINLPDKKVYGVYYNIEGNTASSVQFFLTDSTKRYFRGALYFNETPQYDSIQPVLKFIKKDIDHLIETFQWKDAGRQ